jgi:hypothetical protein
MDLIDKEGTEAVKEVAIARANDLTTGITKMLETIFKIQLNVDGE